MRNEISCASVSFYVGAPSVFVYPFFMATDTNPAALRSFRAGYRIRCATEADRRPLRNREETLGFECASARARHGSISRVESFRLTSSDLADWAVA